MRKPITVFIFILMAGLLLGCNAKSHNITEQESVTGDRLYIVDHYKEKLAAMKLKEVAAMPYFHSPFIVVAADEAGQQFAIIFREDGTKKAIPLPVTYEQIVDLVEQRGFDLSTVGSSWNLHLFEINQKLYWVFGDGQGQLVLDLNGHEVADPFQQDELNDTSS
ncbi:hypothetical protein A8990_13265 [Paenibacillus taihuensis]|uniref:Uncharacterized protein n=1 Tax=Paenibacillus taihuensis TaxID=1156355 RepID=A0A3D9QW88_9BACL|nr:hypothetical protein [Paenibacillus taihuensis]REE69667.1 hypothetical protein A8990_13265 [Paenibacillus taihuensis]